MPGRKEVTSIKARVDGYAKLQAARRRSPGAYWVQIGDMEILPSWPWSQELAQREAEDWSKQVALLEAQVLALNPPNDTPLDGPLIDALDRAVGIVDRLSNDVPEVRQMVERERQRLRERLGRRLSPP
jgi:hypothetical protein